MTDAMKILKDYTDTLTAVERNIPSWEKQAQAFNNAEEIRNNTLGQIKALEARLVELEAEHSGLKGPYLDALFSQDASEQRKLQTQKKKLDQEMSGIEKAISDKRASLQPMDTKGVARLQAAVDSFEVPDLYAVLDQVKAHVQQTVSDLESRVHDVAISLPANHDEEVYRSVRMELDPRYAREERELERSRQRAAERKPASTFVEANDTGTFIDRNNLVRTGVTDRVATTVTDKPYDLDD